MTSPPPAGPVNRRIPPGDDRPRLMCDSCGYVAYENPKVIVGSVVRADGRVLLCKRAIEPRRGFWTLPAGYLELNETTEAGARREAWEEARAVIAVDGLLAVWNVPRISQVQLIYRARLIEPDIAAGPESEAVGLYGWDEIPWAELAFPTVAWSLRADRDAGPGPLVPITNSSTEDKPGL